VIGLTVRLPPDAVGDDLLDAIAVEAKMDARISIDVDRETRTIVISSVDLVGLQAAMNTIFRMLRTADEVARALSGEG